jgi:hypothetical protein
MPESFPCFNLRKLVKSVVSNPESELNSLTLPYGNRFSGHSERRIKIANWGTAEVSLTTQSYRRGCRN